VLSLKVFPLLPGRPSGTKPTKELAKGFTQLLQEQQLAPVLSCRTVPNPIEGFAKVAGWP
jgi:hypothetical protein